MERCAIARLVSLVQPKANVRYIYFKSADGYSELGSCFRFTSQTLMAYERQSSLSVDNGAPIRLANQTWLQAEQVGDSVTLVSDLLPSRGYWEDQG